MIFGALPNAFLF